jgi:SepF-like predicted cell division protein (DUF552 family)
MTLKAQLEAHVAQHPSTFTRGLTKLPDVYAWVLKAQAPTLAEQIYCRLHDLEQAPATCNHCGKPFSKFRGLAKGYQPFCSMKCAVEYKRANDVYAEITKKIKQTSLERYGVENPFQAEEVKTKTKATMLERYGASHQMQSTDIKAKVRATCEARYGVKHHLASPVVRAKVKQTNMKRYGVENPFQAEEVKAKVKAKNLLIFDVEHSSQRPEVKQRVAKKARARFAESDHWAERIRFIESSYSVKLLTTKEEHVAGKPLVWQHSCGQVYEAKLDGSNDIRRCPNPKCKAMSAPQRELFDYVKTLGTWDIIANDRTVIKPYELDVYIPALSIAIELDGIYWHQTEACKSKQALCEAKGIRLLHITDLAWRDHKEIWKSIIASKLGVTKRIYARKCEVINLETSLARGFLEKNHLQGAVGASVNFGLLYENELVAAMTFGKPRFNKHYEWELLRYASKLNTTVVGGASKLLKAFKAEHEGLILSYAKREHSMGGLYKALGFTLLDEGKPSYNYIIGDKLISRYQAQKHKLPELLGDKFDPAKTEVENMLSAGYLLVPDRGSMTFGLE